MSAFVQTGDSFVSCCSWRDDRRQVTLKFHVRSGGTKVIHGTLKLSYWLECLATQMSRRGWYVCFY